MFLGSKPVHRARAVGGAGRLPYNSLPLTADTCAGSTSLSRLQGFPWHACEPAALLPQVSPPGQDAAAPDKRIQSSTLTQVFNNPAFVCSASQDTVKDTSERKQGICQTAVLLICTPFDQFAAHLVLGEGRACDCVHVCKRARVYQLL